MKFDKKKKRQVSSNIMLMVRLFLGCLFIYSGLPKILHPHDFLYHVYSYELVGPKLGMLTAMILPWLELLVGMCLVGGVFVGGALLASAVMTAMFTFVLLSSIYRGLEISCGCFGGNYETISYLTVARTGTLFLCSIVGVYFAIFHSRAQKTIGIVKSFSK